ncbi:MAG TPA: hypothetical protein VN648_20575, partial [Candidatus Methylomirabilis sp.]|nr:hypothetical protein [Candidatus Methylomirabilis sp.]
FSCDHGILWAEDRVGCHGLDSPGLIAHHNICKEVTAWRAPAPLHLPRRESAPPESARGFILKPWRPVGTVTSSLE